MAKVHSVRTTATWANYTPSDACTPAEEQQAIAGGMETKGSTVNVLRYKHGFSVRWCAACAGILADKESGEAIVERIVALTCHESTRKFHRSLRDQIRAWLDKEPEFRGYSRPLSDKQWRIMGLTVGRYLEIQKATNEMNRRREADDERKRTIIAAIRAARSAWNNNAPETADLMEQAIDQAEAYLVGEQPAEQEEQAEGQAIADAGADWQSECDSAIWDLIETRVPARQKMWAHGFRTRRAELAQTEHGYCYSQGNVFYYPAAWLPAELETTAAEAA